MAGEEEPKVEAEEEEEVEEPEAGSESEQEAEAEEGKEAEATKPPTDELKVIIVIKDDKVLLGVQKPECDPVYTTMKGDLGEALKKVKGLVTEAKQKWEVAKRNPKANLPEPAPRPVSTGTRTSEPKAQPQMF